VAFSVSHNVGVCLSVCMSLSVCVSPFSVDVCLSVCVSITLSRFKKYGAIVNMLKC